MKIRQMPSYSMTLKPSVYLLLKQMCVTIPHLSSESMDKLSKIIFVDPNRSFKAYDDLLVFHPFVIREGTSST